MSEHILHEIAGASERPANSRIRITTHENGGFLIRLPASGTTLLLGLATLWLLMCTAAFFYLGLMVFILDQDSAIVHSIVPYGLSGPLRPWRWPLAALWLAMLVFSAVVVRITTHAAFGQESIWIDRHQVILRHTLFGHSRDRLIPLASIRTARILPPADGMGPMRLELWTAEGTVPLGEHLRDPEREWLATVMAALLKRVGSRSSN